MALIFESMTSYMFLIFLFVLYFVMKSPLSFGKKFVKRSHTYLTHVCRLLQSVESPERADRKQKLSANTVALISCRSRLTIMLADVARGEGKWGWERLNVNTGGLSGLNYGSLSVLTSSNLTLPLTNHNFLLLLAAPASIMVSLLLQLMKASVG